MSSSSSPTSDRFLRGTARRRARSTSLLHCGVTWQTHHTARLRGHFPTFHGVEPVYEAYLGQMDTLRSAELSAVFNAYDAIGRARDVGARFKIAWRTQEASQDPTTLVAIASTVLFGAEHVVKDLERALEELAPTKEAVQQLRAGRGSRLDALIEMETAVQDALREKPNSQDDT
jgi:hypothetical protein